MKNPIGIARRTASALRSHLLRHSRHSPEPVPAGDLGTALRAFRAAALWCLALLIATADGAAFSESYRGLFEWAQQHGFRGYWAAAFPLQVDLFIVVGEIALFIAMTDAWRWRDRLGAWAVAGLGLAVSIAGNIGHVHAHDLQTRGTAAVPPVAAFGALWLGLGVLKRILRARQGKPLERGLDGAPRPVVQAAPDQPETAEPPSRARLVLALAGTGSREDVGKFLGISKSKMQRLVTEARGELTPVPEKAPAPDWDGEFRAELETSANGSGTHG